MYKFRLPSQACRIRAWMALCTATGAMLFAGGGCPQAPGTNANSNGNGNAATDQNVAAQQIAGGFVSPVALVDPGDGTGRLFVVDQIGLIWVLTDTGVSETPFLDVGGQLVSLASGYEERGLLGLAFNPDFATNEKFYVFYTAATNGDSTPGAICDVVVSEWRISANDPNRADELSERILLRFSKPQANHNGGQLAFGPDGLLYISVGDGGGANDDAEGHTAGIGNAQDRSNLLGKILRIDVDRGDPYAIPAGNPFVDDAAARPEVYAFGLRNPWRFSFDVSGGATRLFAGDAGQNLFEEVDLIVKGGNYGWRIREGDACFNPASPTRPPATCAETGAGGEPLIAPIFAYGHTTTLGQGFGTSVIGGYVYRGTAIPSLSGKYIFGDFSASFLGPGGKVFIASESGGSWSFAELLFDGTTSGRLGRFVLGFGRDSAGEVYVLTSASVGLSGQGGEVWRIVPGN